MTTHKKHDQAHDTSEPEVERGRYAHPLSDGYIVEVTPSERRATIAGVRVDGERVTVITADGRAHSIPRSRSSRLAGATAEQCARFEIYDFGMAIRWPDVDEDLGLATFLGIDEDDLYDNHGFTAGSA